MASFILSDHCPDELRAAAIKHTMIVTEANGRTLTPEEEEKRRISSDWLTAISRGNAERLLTHSKVAAADKDKISDATTQIKQELLDAGLILNDEQIVVPIHLSDEDRTHGGKGPYGMLLGMSNVVYVSDHLIGNEQLLRRTIAHELIHTNETFTNGKPEATNRYPRMRSDHDAFVREGIVDWLANNHVMGAPGSHPDALGNPEWSRANCYALNVRFVEESIVPHLRLAGRDSEEGLLSFLRAPHGETCATRAFDAIPGLLEFLLGDDVRPHVYTTRNP